MPARESARLPVLVRDANEDAVVLIDVPLRSFSKKDVELCFRLRSVWETTDFYRMDGDLWVNCLPGPLGEEVELIRDDDRQIREIRDILFHDIAQAPLVTMLPDNSPSTLREILVDARENADWDCRARAAAPEISERFCLVDGHPWMRSFGPRLRMTRKMRSATDESLAYDAALGLHSWYGEWCSFSVLDDEDIVEGFQNLLTGFWGDPLELEIVSPWRDTSEQYLSMTAERMLWHFLHLTREHRPARQEEVALILAVRQAIAERWPGIDVFGSGFDETGRAAHLYGRMVPLPYDLQPLLHEVMVAGEILGLKSWLPSWRLAVDWIDLKLQRLDPGYADLAGLDLLR